MKKENTPTFSGYFLFGLYTVFFISIVFSFRAVSSISIACILAMGLTQTKNLFNLLSKHRHTALFLFGCALFYILQCLALLYTHNIHEGLKLLQRSSGIVLIPFAVFSTSYLLSNAHHRKLLFSFAAILCTGSLYCLAITTYHYFSGSASSTFFYHDLVKPISQHAIQYSILVFIALTFLIEQLKHKYGSLIQSLRISMIVFLSLFLILLSSKLIICVYVLYLLYFFFRGRNYKTGGLAVVSIFIAIVVVLTATPNPIGNRFRGIFTGKSTLFTQERFTQGTYFNGVQFRLLEWRFTYDILNEQNAWLSGVTPGDAQSLLNEKYIEKNMYTGIPGTSNRGYLNYHTHNQFLQSLLENGLPALFVFLFICFSLLSVARVCKRTELKWLAGLLLIYCFTDAPFATQYGIVIFTFFPAFLYAAAHTTKIGHGFKKPSLPKFIKTTGLKQPN